MQIETFKSARRRDVHTVFVVMPRCNLTTLITMIETLRIGNYLLEDPAFSWDIVSFDGAGLTASNGMTFSARTDIEAVDTADQIFLMGSWGAEHYANAKLTAWLRKTYREGARLCAVEMSVFVLARAGLLDNKAATTHWSMLPGFQEGFDRVRASERLFTSEERIMTCAGGLAGVDLMLRLIETSHGAGLSGEIADQMLHHPIRSGETPQRHTLGRSTETMLPILRQAFALIESNIEDPLTVPEIAQQLNVSQRQLERQFKRHIGCTVVQFGLLMRLQNARVLLITTSLSVREIATASGFNTLPHFAHSFRKFFGRRPSEYREAWPQDQPAPTWPGTLAEYLATQRSGRTEPTD